MFESSSKLGKSLIKLIHKKILTKCRVKTEVNSTIVRHSPHLIIQDL